MEPCTAYLQGVATLFYACGIVGSWLPRALPGLRSLIAYGKLEDLSLANGSTEPSTCRINHLVQAVRQYQVPKAWFAHFYILALLNTCLVLYQLSASNHREEEAVVPVLLFFAHICRRLYECVQVHVWSPTARMPLPLYAVGMMHYVFVPWTLASTSASPTWDLAHMLDTKLCRPLTASAPERSCRVWVVASCAVAFVLASGIQHEAHRHLASLRAGSSPTSVRHPLAGSSSTAEGSMPRQRQRRTTMPSMQGRGRRGSAASVRDLASKARRKEAADSARSPSPSRTGRATSSARRPPLRHALASPTQRSSYVLPQGGYFDNCWSPHYTSEIALYCALLLLRHSLLAERHTHARVLATTTSTMMRWLRSVLSPTVAVWLQGLPGLGYVYTSFAAPVCTSLHSTLWPSASSLHAWAPLALLLWVGSNLTATALSTKEWYLQHFPREEKRIRQTAAIFAGLL